MGRQADGAVLVSYGETVVLVAAVAEPCKRELDFFPLGVEYREKQYAAGKIPGGIIKREGRPTTKEIVTMRLTDRPIRPLFPEDYAEEVQVQCNVLSADGENDPDVLSMVGASAALAISDIPFQGPIGACRVGLVEDEFVINPTHEERERSELEMVVAGTSEAIVMVEGSARVIPEEDVLTAIAVAQDVNVELTRMIGELVALREADGAGRPTRSYTPLPAVEPALARVQERYGERIAELDRAEAGGQGKTVKLGRREAMQALRDEATQELLAEQMESGGGQEAARSPQSKTENVLTPAVIRRAFEKLEGQALRRRVLETGARDDGRTPDEIREVTCEIGVLPRTHGSALFTRGGTQALVITTLGSVRDEQRVLDPLVQEDPKKFMVHYNFPPFCVGEVRPIRGPGRREIGHGELSERALLPVLPSPDRFPYTIRLVSDILESNGSSSMASVCGGTLSMMDAGVPIKDPVAGVAMGAIVEGERAVVLTDITGEEDHYGDMDLKLAGTQKGVTALQLDLKVHGVGKEVLRKVMMRAREARVEILRTMLGTIRAPRASLSPYAPVLRRVKIDPEKIGALIGPGGRTIKRLESEFLCDIEVEDDGTVTVSGDASADADGAIRYIGNLGAGVEVGKTYEGQVTQIKDFGAIVELFPGTDGLCHVSELDRSYVKNVEDVCKVGDKVRVKVLSVEGDRIKLSRKAALDEQ